MNTQQNTNNKQTKEETQQEVWKKTEADFEKQRRKLTRSLWYQLPFGLIGGLAGVFLVGIIWYLEIFVERLSIGGLFAGIAASVGICVAVYMTITGFLENFSVSQKIEGIKTTVQEQSSKRDALSTKLEESKAIYEKQSNFVDWMQDPNITIITPDPIWPAYIVGMAKQTGNEAQQLQQTYDVLDEEIVRLEAELQFYNQVQEKNFWQYFKSRKWLKKVK